jgi:hypothetical protein
MGESNDGCQESERHSGRDQNRNELHHDQTLLGARRPQDGRLRDPCGGLGPEKARGGRAGLFAGLSPSAERYPTAARAVNRYQRPILVIE